MTQPKCFRWFVGLLSLAFSVFGAGPDNDHFKDRFTLSGVETRADVWLLDATSEPNEPNHAAEPYNPRSSAWWTWTAPTDGYVELSCWGHRATVYRGASLESLVRLSGPQPATGFVPQFRVSRGEILQIVVCGWQAPGQPPVYPLDFPTVLHLQIHPLPTNDDFQDRQRLAGSTHRLAGNMGGASEEAGEPRHGFVGPFASLWWEWTPTISGLASINYVLGGRADMVHLYRGAHLSELIPIPPEEGHPFAVKAGEPVQIAIATEVWPEIGPTLGAFEVRAVVSAMRLVTPAGGLVLDRPGPLRLKVEGVPDGAGSFVVGLNGRERIFLSQSATNLIVPHLGVGKHRLRVVGADSWGAEFYTPEEIVLVQSGADTFQQAQTLPVALDGAVWMSSVGGDFSRAVREAGEPPPAEGTATESGTIWWHWRCTAAGRLIFGGANAQPDVRYANVEAFVGSGLENLSRLETSEVSGWYATARGISVELGRDYWLRLTHSGPAPHDWAEVPVTFQSAAPGDVFADAVPLPSDEFVVPLPAQHATFEPDEPGQRNNDFGSRWFIVRPAGDSLLNLEVAPWHVGDTPLELFMGENLATLVPVAGPTKYLTTRLAGGQTYWAKLTVSNGFRASDEAWVVGYLGLRPPNDDFAQAITIPPVAEGVVTGSNRHATTESGQPESLGIDQSVWFKFTAPEQGALVVRTEAVDNPNEILPRLMFARGSQLSNLTPAAEQVFGSTGQAVELDAGEQVFLMLSGPNHVLAAHSFALHYRFVNRPPNDGFSGRVTLAGTRVSTRGTNWLASREPGEPLAYSRGSGRTTWWTWTAPANGYLDISCSNLLAGLFTGGSLSTLIPIQPIDLTNRFLGGLRFPVVAGTSYQLQLDRNDPFAERDPFGPNGLQGTDLGLRLSSVVLASPSNHAVLNADHPLRFALSALDPALDETPQSVTFWMWTNHVANQKAISLGTVATPPFELELPRFAPGHYLFEAVVTNAAGESVLSPVAAVRIAPANDAFADAAELVGHKITETAFWSGASAEPGEPPGVPAGRGSIWYRWTAPASGVLGIALFGSGNFDLYSGSSLSGLRVMPWSGTVGREYAVTNGNTYHLRIIGGAEVPGAGSKSTFSMDLRSVAFVTPAAGAKIATGQSIPIRLRISAAPETVGRVELRAGTNLIATVQGPGWSFTWQKPPPGLQTILASVVSPTGKVLSEVSRQVLVASPNDLVSAPIQLEGASGRTEVSGLAATPDLPGDSSGYVWYRWVAPGDGVLFIQPAFSNATPAIVLFSGVEPTSWQRVTNRLGDSSPRPVGQWAVKHGATNWLGVVTSSFEPFGELFWEWTPAAANDAFSSRINLTGDAAEMTTDFTLASLEEGEPFSWQPPSDLPAKGSLWWNWVPPQSGLLEITLPPGKGQSVSVIVGRGARLATFEPIGDPRPLEQNSWFPIPESRLYPVVEGQSVQIALLSIVPDAQNVGWNWQFHPVPANDHFAQRSVMTSDRPGRGSLLGATLDAGAPALPAPASSDVWWTWTAPTDGEVGFQITEGDGSHFLGVYRGNTLSGLQPVVFYSILGTEPATDFVPVLQGQVLQLRLGRWDGPGGNYALALDFRPRPGNDDFDDRILLSGDQVRVAGANWRTSRELGEPYHAGHFGGRSVWYSWQAPGDGEAVVTPIDGAAISGLLLAAYQGNAVTALQPVAAVATGPERAPLRFAVHAGEHYSLAIDGSFGLTTSFGLDLQFVSNPPEAPRLALELLPEDQLRVIARQVPAGTWALEECADLSVWVKVADVPAGEVHSLTLPAADLKALRLFRLRR